MISFLPPEYEKEQATPALPSFLPPEFEPQVVSEAPKVIPPVEPLNALAPYKRPPQGEELVNDSVLNPPPEQRPGFNPLAAKAPITVQAAAPLTFKEPTFLPPEYQPVTQQDIESQLPALQDVDEGKYWNLVAKQFTHNLARTALGVQAEFGRQGARLFGSNEGAYLRDERGAIVGAQVAPTAMEDRKLWEENLIAQHGDKVDFVSAKDALNMQSVLEKPDMSWQDRQRYISLNAENTYLSKMSETLFDKIMPADAPMRSLGKAADEFKAYMRGEAEAFTMENERVAELMANDNAAQIEEVLGPKPSWERMQAIGTSSSLGQMFPSMMLFMASRGTAANPALTLGSFGVSTGSVTGLDEGEAGTNIALTRKMQTITAWLEMATELPTLRALNDISSPLLRQYLQTLYIELPTEVANTILNDIAHEIIVEPDRPVADFLRDLGQHTLSTMLMTPVLGGAQVGTIRGISAAAEGADKVATKLFGQSRVAQLAKDAMVKVGDKLVPAGYSAAHQRAADNVKILTEVNAWIENFNRELDDSERKIAPFDLEIAMNMDPDIKNIFNLAQPDYTKTPENFKHTDQAFEGTDIALERMFERLPFTRADGIYHPGQAAQTMQPGEVAIIGMSATQQITTSPVFSAMKPKAQTKALALAAKRDAKENAVRELVQSLITKFAPGQKVLLNFNFDVANHANVTKPRVRANEGNVTISFKSSRGQDNHNVITMNSVDSTAADLANIAFHEVGHLLYTSIRKRLEAAGREDLLKYVEKAYVEQMRKAVREKTSRKSFRHLGTAERGDMLNAASRTNWGLKRTVELIESGQKLRKNADGTKSSQAGYFYGLDEFIAEQMIRVAAGTSELQGEALDFFKQVNEPMTALFDEMNQHPEYKANENYAEYVNSALKLEEIARLTEQREQLIDMQLAALEEMAQMKPWYMGPAQLNALIDNLVENGGPAVDLALAGNPVQNTIPSHMQEWTDPNAPEPTVTPSFLPKEYAASTPTVAEAKKPTVTSGVTNPGPSAPPAIPTPPAAPPLKQPPGRAKYDRVMQLKQRINADQTKFTFFTNWIAGVVQIARMNPNIESMQHYLRGVTEMNNIQSFWTAKAVDVFNDWRDHVGNVWMTSDHQERFDAALIEIDGLSEAAGKRLTAGHQMTILQKHGLDQSDLQMMQRIWGLYTEGLNAMEQVIIKRIQEVYAHTPNPDYQAMMLEIAKVRSDFSKMRNRNYVPHTRFGKYRVEVKAIKDVAYKGVTYKAGSTIFYTGSDTIREHNALMKIVNAEFASDFYGVRTDEILDDDMQAFAGLQPEMASLIAKAIGLSEAQRKQLDELLIRTASGQSIRKHMLERKRIAGYSDNMQRVFADYFSRFAPYIARIEGLEALDAAITLSKQELNRISGKGRGDKLRRRRQRLIAWMEKHREYLLNPGNEFANIRAAGFVFYLGFVPKSAFVNMTQVPFVAAPYLGARFGDVNAGAEIIKTMKDVTQHFVGKANSKIPPIDAEILQMWDILKSRQILDEGMTTMLSGMANDRSLIRLKADGVTAQSIRTATTAAGYLFQTAEKINRYFVATAAFRLARKSGMNQVEATDFAYTAVQDTQLEYARFNRPRAMRGVTSPIFLFYQYLSQMMYFVGQDPAKWRYLMMLLVMAGYTGLPGAQTFLNVMDSVITRFKGRMGLTNPKTQLRIEIAEIINVLADNTSWLPHQSAAFFEKGFFGNFFGYDIQASISLGELLLFDSSILATESDPEGKLGQILVDASGAPAEAAAGMLLAVFSEEPYNWNTLKAMAPVTAKNQMKAYERYTDQQVQDASGNIIMKFDETNPYGFTTFLAEAAGFARADINRMKQTRFMANDAVRYYQNQESMINTSYFNMMQRSEGNNPPSQKDWDNFYKRVDRFNNGVREMDPRLLITNGSLMDSYSARKSGALTQDIYGHRIKQYGEMANQIIETRR